MYMEEVVLCKEEEGIDLPPGFRFHPTDEEIISHYLTPKVMNSGFKAIAVGEADLNKSEPWDLPDNKARSSTGEKENYFFCQRDRKYPTGMRTNRATAAGYWKATGKDKEIYRGRGCLVGMKKTLVFYKGRAPKGEKTNWVMHEFRLEGKLSYCNLPKGAKDEWVVCRIFHKNAGAKKSPIMHPHDLLRMNSFGDEFFDYASLPPLMDSGPTYSDRPGCSYQLQDHIISTPNSSAQHHHHQQPLKSSYISMSYNQQPHDIDDQASGGGVSFIMHPNSNFGSYPNPGCKLEQFSSNTNNNQSIPSLSQDTGLSTEINNNEISSKQIGTSSCTKSFEDITDLDTFWADDDYN